MEQKFFGFKYMIEVALKLGSKEEASKLAIESLECSINQEKIGNDTYPNQIYINDNEIHLLFEDIWMNTNWKESELSEDYNILEYKEFIQ